LRRELGISPGERAVGTIAALRSWKGHDYLLEAAGILTARRKNIKFVIAGEGPRYNHLMEKADSLGIKERVLFLGYRDDVDNILSALDIVALPSYANEGVPQALLQAMAMEKPVVACSAGSIPEIVHDKKTGILVETKNPAALAESIASMLDNQAAAKTVAENARKLVESQYSLNHMVTRVEETYSRMLRTGHKEMKHG
jgi:glycosyltransferase involved in cell wall biosynthesis